MNIVPNTSLDETTINDNVPALTFVKEPNVQLITRDIPKSMNTVPNENIENIQNYLKNNEDVNYLINENYDGPIDGLLNEKLINIAKSLEKAISETINKNVNGIILKTTANDLKSALKKVVAFKKNNQTKQVKISQDQRIYELGKLKMSKK